MPEPFKPVANTIFRLVLFGAVAFLAFVLWIGFLTVRSPYEMMQHVPREQPVPFSHEHHAGALGIDCRFCHTTVEESAFAGIPSTHVCMHCHSQMWATAPALAAVRRSYVTNLSIQWTKVYSLPDYVYFNHAIHVNKGIGCNTCHGRVEHMPLTWQAPRLTMSWCLECHRNPEYYVRPKSEVFNMNYSPPADQYKIGMRLVREYHIKSMTSCSTCHR